VQIEVDRKEAKINMRVDQVTQLNELIASVFEAIAFPSLLVLAVALLIVGALELRSRMRRPRNARDRQDRGRSGRVAPAT
jgi:hypothetical protein